MKKLIAVLLLVLSAFVLVACEETTDEAKDTTKPVIIGADAVTIEVGTAFDPKSGVTATDNVDGDLTAAIVVSGTYDVNKAAVYTLTYTVKDKAGNEGSKTRELTVTEKAPLGNLTGGDFSGTALPTGWGTWYDQTTGYDAAYSVENGAAVIDIKAAPATDTQWWAVQLHYKSIKLEPFVSYTLKFKAKADQERYMNHQIQGGNIPGGKAYGEKNFTKLTTAWQEFTVNFYVKGAAENAELQFSFGNYAADTTVPAEFKAIATKVYLDDVQIVAGPELENQAPEITASDLVVKVGTPTPIKQGIAVVDDFSVIEIADVTVVQKAGETVFTPADPKEGVYTFTITAKDGEGLETTKTRTITVASVWSGAQTFNILENVSGWDVPKGIGWYTREVDGEYLTTTEAEGVTSVKIDAMTPDDYKSTLSKKNIQFFKGTYVIKFEVKAEAARKLRVAIEGAGLEANVAFRHIDITTTWTEVSLTYTFNTDQMNKGIDFMFGSLTTVRAESSFTAADDILTTVSFRNLSVEYTA